jgi:hypothetical protein
MNNKAIGIVLLVIGAGLAFWGHDIAQSVQGQFTRIWSGGVPDKAMWLYVAGAACAALGLYFLARRK